ncbi:23S rRNA (adenine(2503)-C(2))-methyltransferase RlmN [Clostridium sp. CX1]|uniref:Probable dual-specificity RNA methyltransferase RlmN n=1 Tax=Clostridium tanneri TaxID=3037988 RepID=A0ABU4JSF1_9CLOT|nr:MULTISPECIES: 23S rRNA (adenine(2503)-C(2))-methyltransferase RlmN [unclassified Clostridium]MCT8976877.1 23S rRNA (adenine(2503)-C(2))-methyltransferase RlmN [Clostridium sp. CX1]MDW8801082.1 23S rRNA (adenine(2503)-C(2))-methyltransferase RlmN [Clostridium sp. A1-XYC3]
MYNILDFSLDKLKQWMKDNKESEFRAKQIFDWIYKKNIWNFEDMSNIPKNIREKLNNSFYIEIPQVVDVYKSNLDDTFKFLFKYRDGNIIESVVMKYKHGNSICVSTQIGCRMGCKFCASTLGGMIRNLTSGEILAQVLKAQQEIEDRISNIVLMGSGEPLDNYDNVMEFLDIVRAEYSVNVGQRHITLSTCGIVPRIKELADKNLQITLAISLHAPNDDLRRNMMPIAYKYSINEVMDACRYYINTTKRRVTFEYALVRNVNDNNECAKQLIDLLKGLLCHVNLIPVNEVKENNFKKSSSDNIKKFYNMLIEAGIETTIRREMGSDISAACGQLRRSYLESKNDLKGV